MELLMIYCTYFGYKIGSNQSDISVSNKDKVGIENAIVGFIQAEAEDVEDETSEESIRKVTTKLIKNLKWLAKKNSTRNIVLHSFAHLSESKADPESVKRIFNQAEERLKNSGYNVMQTPFGYFLDLEVKAPGYSLARVFKSF